MYHLYHTGAVVVGSSPSGEASKTILLFTRELGLVSARAQGVRGFATPSALAAGRKARKAF